MLRFEKAKAVRKIMAQRNQKIFVMLMLIIKLSQNYLKQKLMLSI